ncbi:MAG: magnesium/cobalt transporter CorA [Termitinemataceae bacterium]|nr:MAG: magnesium/cobalt transporter CorA [Termitinemataceae bacterium]
MFLLYNLKVNITVINHKNIGLPPGTPVYIGDRSAHETDLSIINYDKNSCRFMHLDKAGDLLQFKNSSSISWINVSGLKDIASIKYICGLYNIHDLSAEDILNTEQQPKFEAFKDYQIISLKSIKRENNFRHENKTNETVDEFLIDQISIIIMKNVLLTFQEIPGDSFEGIIKRIEGDEGRIREMGTDYLAYRIIDTIVDEYFLTLAHLEDDIEDFENRATKESDDTFIEEIQETKKYLLKIRRSILPLKENLKTISKEDNPFFSNDLKPFFHDLNENLGNAIASVENHREWLSGIMDVNLSFLSIQTNKVMKVLAIISTIFIPLTFIAGVYGMNFDYMPELRYTLSYPIVLIGMALIALIMLLFFKKRHWF